MQSPLTDKEGGREMRIIGQFELLREIEVCVCVYRCNLRKLKLKRRSSWPDNRHFPSTCNMCFSKIFPRRNKVLKNLRKFPCVCLWAMRVGIYGFSPLFLLLFCLLVFFSSSFRLVYGSQQAEIVGCDKQGQGGRGRKRRVSVHLFRLIHFGK